MKLELVHIIVLECFISCLWQENQLSSSHRVECVLLRGVSHVKCECLPMLEIRLFMFMKSV